MDKDTTKISKFLSYVLRHKPESIGIQLSENGWVNVTELLAAAEAHGQPISRELLDEVVQTNNKQRFALSPDGEAIRANQGYSVKHVELNLVPTTPPPMLYHGTVERFLSLIEQQGLQKMNRHHVHLSATTETAMSVGGRRGKPVVLSVDCCSMHAAGYEFFLSENGVWLTDHVPTEFIRFPSS